MYIFFGVNFTWDVVYQKVKSVVFFHRIILERGRFESHGTTLSS